MSLNAQRSAQRAQVPQYQVRSSSSRPIRSGSSQVGTWPQPSSETRRASGSRSRTRASCRGINRRSRVPHATVTGHRIDPSSLKPCRCKLARNVASNPGASVNARSASAASGAGTRQGRACICERSKVRPNLLPTACSTTGRSARAIHRLARSDPRANHSPGRDQKPPGEIAMTERALPSFASSSATHPPSELPATCAVCQPHSSRNAATSRASAAGDGTTSAGKGADCPKPGRSAAITSRSRATASSTGRQTCQQPPRP
jgi:hypothetical protein